MSSEVIYCTVLYCLPISVHSSLLVFAHYTVGNFWAFNCFYSHKDKNPRNVLGFMNLYIEIFLLAFTLLKRNVLNAYFITQVYLIIPHTNQHIKSLYANYTSKPFYFLP